MRGEDTRGNRKTVAGESRPVTAREEGFLCWKPILPLPAAPSAVSREKAGSYPSKTGSFLLCSLPCAPSGSSRPPWLSTCPSIPHAHFSVRLSRGLPTPARWQRTALGGRARIATPRPAPLHTACSLGGRARSWGTGPGMQPACSSWDRRQLQLTSHWRVRGSCRPAVLEHTFHVHCIPAVPRMSRHKVLSNLSYSDRPAAVPTGHQLK